MLASRTSWGFRWDFVVHNALGRPALTVEVKNRASADEQWAKEFWEKFGPGVAGTSMLLVSRDRAFWWAPGAGLDQAPTRTMQTTDLLKQHLTDIPYVDEVVLTVAVGFWLEDVISGSPAIEASTRTDLGLDALVGGTIYHSK
ncbi:MAG: hypothetical protein JWM10_2791 [Myxococcaceae bacterium]|nr:hypothetical protein [Myxococcaceae bacterium]